MIAIGILAIYSVFWMLWIWEERNSGDLVDAIFGGFTIGAFIATPLFLILPVFGPTHTEWKRPVEMNVTSLAMHPDYPTDLDSANIIVETEDGLRYIDYETAKFTKKGEEPYEIKTCQTNYDWLVPYGWNDCDRDIYINKPDLKFELN